MDGLALGARIALAIAFAFAAFAKLRDRGRVTAQMRELVGARLAPAASMVVPVVELSCAVMLVALPQQSFPGWIAAAVLLVFTVVLVRAAVRHVPCPCFGSSTSTHPVGAPAIVRNGVLLALAVLATA